MKREREGGRERERTNVNPAATPSAVTELGDSSKKEFIMR